MGSQAGRKVFTLQTLPACEPDEFADTAGKISGVSLHAGVAGQGRRAQETGASVSLHQPASRCEKALVVDTGRQCSLPAEDTVPRKLAP